jgi:hypothetical protein
MSDKAKGIFSGVALTQHTPLARTGTDQRLFAPPPQPEPTPPPAPAPVAAAEEPSPLPTKESRKVDTSKPRNLGTKVSKNLGQAQPQSPAMPDGPYDFDDRPGRQANFIFTEDELDGLDDLKRDVKRRFDLRTTKQDLVRYAVVELLNDFAVNGEGSRVIQWLKRRQRRGG